MDTPPTHHPDPASIVVRPVDYTAPQDASALVHLLDGYARDPAGGGTGLAPSVRANLAQALARRADAFSVLAWRPAPVGAEPEPVGLINCFEGFSTFACRPLVNIHDVVVVPHWRGMRIAQRMLAVVEQLAQERGACKLTLEVLSGNESALKLYMRDGFEGYALDPAMGEARFLQKKLL